MLENDNHKSSLTHKIKFLSKALVGLSHIAEGWVSVFYDKFKSEFTKPFQKLK